MKSLDKTVIISSHLIILTKPSNTQLSLFLSIYTRLVVVAEFLLNGSNHRILQISTTVPVVLNEIQHTKV